MAIPIRQSAVRLPAPAVPCRPLPWALVFQLLFLLISPGLAKADVRFVCEPSQLAGLEIQMTAYLRKLAINPKMVVRSADRDNGVLQYELATPAGDTDTLDFSKRKGFNVQPETISLPSGGGKGRRIDTVSRKEILLALLQHGRITQFDGRACILGALADHIGLRQNIAAWAEVLHWEWPNGGPARWNSRYWKDGTPKKSVPITVALTDAFQSQDKYAIGCYTATKMVVTHGVMDFFQRIKSDSHLHLLIENRLLADGDPLVDVEPARMWSFEKEFDPATLPRPGKLLRLVDGVAPRNFIPGDWVYFLNTDPRSARKTGYEGSNAIYLGRGRFDDYYNDNHHAYTFDQKLDEVYQWRNGVFSRSRDFRKHRKLHAMDYRRLAKTPENGGLVLDIRAIPHLFGYEALPPLSKR